MTLLFRNGRIWDGKKFYYSDVLIENGIISKIDKQITKNADYVYDADGMTVSAGLVDAHIHMRGVSSDQYGIQAEMATLPFGVTAAADAWASKGDKKFIDSFLIKNTVFAGVNVKNDEVVFDDTEKILKAYENRAVGIKLAFDMANPDIRSINPLVDAVKFAEKIGMVLLIHSSGSPVPMADIVKHLRKGDIITHAFHGGENNSSLDSFECLKCAQSKGILIDVGFAGHVHTDFSVLRSAISSGVIPDIISSDITHLSAYTRGARYGLTTCMSIARDSGMSEEQVFSAVTATPAMALKKESEWGFLREGCNADIAVLSYADEGYFLTDKSGNTVSSKTGYRCEMTVVNGSVIFKR